MILNHLIINHHEKILIEEMLTIRIEIEIINELDSNILLFNITKGFNMNQEDKDIITINHIILEMIIEGIIENIGNDKLIKKI